MDIEIKNIEKVKSICEEGKNIVQNKLLMCPIDIHSTVTKVDNVWWSTGRDVDSYKKKLLKQAENLDKLCTVLKDFFNLIYSYAVSVENTSKATVESGSTGSGVGAVVGSAVGSGASEIWERGIFGGGTSSDSSGKASVSTAVSGVAAVVADAARAVVDGASGANGKKVTGQSTPTLWKWFNSNGPASSDSSGKTTVTGSGKGTATSTGKTAASSNSGISTENVTPGSSGAPNVSYTINVPESGAGKIADGSGANIGGTTTNVSYNNGYPSNISNVSSGNSMNSPSLVTPSSFSSSGVVDKVGSSVTTSVKDVFTSSKLSNVVPKLSVPNVASGVKSTSKVVPVITGSVAAGAVGLGAAAVIKKKIVKSSDGLQLDVSPEVIDENADTVTIDQKLDSLTLEDQFV